MKTDSHQKLHRAASRRNGFTLVELLCVIGIIALLSTLMMPQLEMARSRAQSIQCASNLHQIGVSVNLYLADHDNMYPYIEPGKPGSGLADPYANYPDLQAQAKTVLDTFQNYGVTDKILQCPADLLLLGVNSNYSKYGTSYYWNPVDDGDPSGSIQLARRFGLRPATQLSRIRQIGDFTPVHKLNSQSVGKTNMLYADGHVVTQ